MSEALVDDTIVDTPSDDSVEFEPVVDDEVVTDEPTTPAAAEDGIEPEGGTEDTGAKFTITVDGQQVEVTLNELLNGYSRQADYTRKTQQLAADRQRFAQYEALERALADNPASAIQALQQVYGVKPTATQEVDLDSMDPVERKVYELEQEITSLKGTQSQQSEQARLAAIHSEATQAIATHKLQQVSNEDLLQFAMDNRIGSLDVAAYVMSTQRAAAAQAAKVAKTTDAKRQAAVVEGGSTRTTKATAPPKAMTIAEAWAQAKNE